MASLETPHVTWVNPSPWTKIKTLDEPTKPLQAQSVDSVSWYNLVLYNLGAPVHEKREQGSASEQQQEAELSNAAEEDTDAAAMATWSMMPNPLLMKHSWADEQKQDIGDGPIEHSSAVPRPRCGPDFSREMMCSGLGDIFDWSPQACAHEADGSDAHEAPYNHVPPMHGTARRSRHGFRT